MPHDDAVMKALDVQSHFSQVLDRVVHHGERIAITREGKVVAELVPKQVRPARSLTQWLLTGPKCDELELPRRSDSPMREVDL